MKEKDRRDFTELEGDAELPELELDPELQELVMETVAGLMGMSGGYLAARARTVWFRHLLRRLPQAESAALCDRVAAAERALARAEAGGDAEAIAEAEAQLDAAVDAGAAAGLISPQAAAELARRTLDGPGMMLFLALHSYLPPEDVTLVVDRRFAERLAADLETEPPEVLERLQRLLEAHLLLSLTPERPLAGALEQPVTVAVNPMVTENADRERWERARARWQAYLDGLTG